MSYNPDQPRAPKGSEIGGRWIAAGVAARKSAGLPPEDTMTRYMRSDGTWEPERQLLHDEIVAKYFEGKTPVSNPKAYLIGGAPASGKSTLIRSGELNMEENIIAADGDGIKLLLPEMQEGLEQGDLGIAAVVHEESSYLSKLIAKEAGAGGYNVYMDGTGDNSLTSLISKVDNLRAGGQFVEAIYVTIDVDTAVERAWARAAKTGRMVPEAIIRLAHASVSRVVPQAVAAGIFDKFSLWDTSFSPAQKIAEAWGSDLVILNQEAYNKFLEKGK